MTKFNVPTWDANAIGDNAASEAFKHKRKPKSKNIKKAKSKTALTVNPKNLKKQIGTVKRNSLPNVVNGKKNKPAQKKKSPVKGKPPGNNTVKGKPPGNNTVTGKPPGNNTVKNKQVAKNETTFDKANGRPQTPKFKQKKKLNVQVPKNDSMSSASNKKTKQNVPSPVSKLKRKQKLKLNVSGNSGIVNKAVVTSLNTTKSKKKDKIKQDGAAKQNKLDKMNSEGDFSNAEIFSVKPKLNASLKRKKKLKIVNEEVGTDVNKRLVRMDKVREKIKRTLEEKRGSKTRWHELSLRERMMEKLKSARFRYLNEEIYTNTSKDAVDLFKTDPSAFKAYHEGYRQQVARWPLNPLDNIITKIKRMPKTTVVADFGCGEGRLAESVSQKVHSFDIVAANSRITACDMANVPLGNGSVDVVVFCLSLMGTNLIDYLYEANRVLKIGGNLVIAEVESRFDTVETFIAGVERVGFKNAWKDLSHNLFYFLDFKKTADVKNKKKLPTISLHPCLYKKR